MEILYVGYLAEYTAAKMLAVESDCESRYGDYADIPEPNEDQEQFSECETTGDILGKNELAVENDLPINTQQRHQNFDLIAEFQVSG